MSKPEATAPRMPLSPARSRESSGNGDELFLTDNLSDPQSSDTEASAAWPARWALVTAWLMPQTTARRMQHVGMLAAYVVHSVSILLAGISFLIVLSAISSSEYDNLVWLAQEMWRELVREWTRAPVMVGVGIPFVFFAVQAVYILLAGLLAPWGARDESLPTSFREAVRLAWLHTPHWIVGVSLFTAAFAWVENARRDWRTGYPYVAWPWYVRDEELVLFAAFVPLLCWYLWALVRIIGSRPRRPAARRHICEYCGYNLTGAAWDGRCPECGAAVAASLGEDVRPGPAWSHRRTLGIGTAWRQSAASSIRPDAFGRTVRLSDAAADCRSFLATTLVAVFGSVLLSLYGYVVFYSIKQPSFNFDHEFLFGLIPGAGLFVTVLCLFLVSLAAWIAAIWHRRRAERNLLPATIQIAVYMTAPLVFMALAAPTAAVLILENQEFFREIQALMQIDDEIIAFCTWVAVVAAPICFFFYHVVYASTFVRFANR
jgi:hypothetical protein